MKGERLMVKAKGGFLDLADKIADEYTSLASKGESSGEFSGFIDSGCYALNALLSGSIYGGIPNNKITAFCGESATGKSFFALGITDNFLKQNKDAGVIYFDTEAAISEKLLVERGIDHERVIISNPETIQVFQHKALSILENYGKRKDYPLLLI